ncbi:snare associated Golgi protein-domain-containing protein [Earliella scabrosa]|nr:snare associated Golgi protein-domain-containing protein [Earliella scabrosa]
MMKWRYWIRREWAWYYVAFIVCLVGVILFTLYHKEIVHWLRPAADWMHDLPFGWTIPIAVFFVISFPPLFGHEVVAILCGLVWGLGVGFGIVAAGTFLGELGNYYAFKYCCSARGEKLERTKISYACLARVVREGGFKVALIARLSAIPGHFTTAVFSTCGMGVWTFSIAAILSLPKQFITVYLGVALEQSEDGSSSTTDTIIKWVVIGLTTIITIWAMWYIYHEMNKVKVSVIYERRKARQAKMNLPPTPALPYSNPAVLESTMSVNFNPAASNTEIPLTSATYGQPSYAVYAPQPRRPQPPPSAEGYPMSERRQSNGAPPLPPGAGYAYPAPPSQNPMQRVMSPPRDPFSDSARVPSQPQAVSYQRQAPPRGYGSPPPEVFARGQGQDARYQTRSPPQRQPTLPSQIQAQAQRLASPPPGPGRTSAPQTPTHRTFYPSPPPGAPPLPSMSASASTSPPPPSQASRIPPSNSTDATNPFRDPMPNPYEASRAYGHGHEPEPSDATFYTAAGGHSRGVTEESDDGMSSDTLHAPPSYTTLPR